MPQPTSMPPLPPPKPALDPHARAFGYLLVPTLVAGDVLHIEGRVQSMQFSGSVSRVYIVRGLDELHAYNERRKAR